MKANSAQTKCGEIEVAIETREGVFIATYSERGLCGLSFPSTKNSAQLAANTSQLPPRMLTWHNETIGALHDALAGKTPKDLPPLDLSIGTEFQRSVWRTLQKIKCGETWSYGDVAKAIGNPKAVRAVGGACGANPIPVFVPCHRVLAANHKLGGFSSGLPWKIKLLDLEQSFFAPFLGGKCTLSTVEGHQ
jgi:O-6-methylguanine DNA methyltransferase